MQRDDDATVLHSISAIVGSSRPNDREEVIAFLVRASIYFRVLLMVLRSRGPDPLLYFQFI